MRKLNGKGVVSTKEAFQTKSKSGTQHNAAMAAFSQIDGARSTAQSAPPCVGAQPPHAPVLLHAATFCSSSAPGAHPLARGCPFEAES